MEQEPEMVDKGRDPHPSTPQTKPRSRQIPVPGRHEKPSAYHHQLTNPAPQQCATRTNSVA